MAGSRWKQEKREKKKSNNQREKRVANLADQSFPDHGMLCAASASSRVLGARDTAFQGLSNFSLVRLLMQMVAAIEADQRVCCRGTWGRRDLPRARPPLLLHKHQTAVDQQPKGRALIGSARADFVC